MEHRTETSPRIHWQPILDKDSIKRIEETTAPLRAREGTLNIHPYPSTSRRLKLDPISYSVWIENLNARPETLKLLKENIRKTLQDIGTSADFSNRTPIDRTNYVKYFTELKSFTCRRWPTGLEKNLPTTNLTATNIYNILKTNINLWGLERRP